jgi:thiamine-monophosphate kinase
MSEEDQLVARIARSLGFNGGALDRSWLRLGIGDDAAVLATHAGSEWVLSCDAFLEGVHFLADVHPADSIGFKSLARATSDLVAMGARPRLFLLTLALPAKFTGDWLDQFLHGMGRAARRFGMRLAGGDTTKNAGIYISLTVLGEIRPGLAVTRSGARPGDLIYVSGRLGRADLGLKVLRAIGLGGVQSENRLLQIVRPHLYPQIHVELGAWLAERKLASAMMDISDGLSTDLRRMCLASGVGAQIWAERIPRVQIPTGLSGERKAILATLRLDPLQMALDGGDDYELLFTVSPRGAKRLRKAPGFRKIRALGEVRRGRQISLVDANGRAEPLVSGGWDPFGKT